MYNHSFSLKKRKENTVLASVNFIRFEYVIKYFIPNFGNQLETILLNFKYKLCGYYVNYT